MDTKQFCIYTCSIIVCYQEMVQVNPMFIPLKLGDPYIYMTSLSSTFFPKLLCPLFCFAKSYMYHNVLFSKQNLGPSPVKFCICIFEQLSLGNFKIWKSFLTILNILPGVCSIQHKILFAVMLKSRDPFCKVSQIVETTSRGDRSPLSGANIGFSELLANRWGAYLVSTYFIPCSAQSSQNSYAIRRRASRLPLKITLINQLEGIIIATF